MNRDSNSGFNRIRGLAAASSLGVAGLFGGVVSSARAAPTTLSVSVTTGGAQWTEIGTSTDVWHSFLAQTIYGVTTTTTSYPAAYGIGDASLPAVSQGDAFDHMFGLSVDGAAFLAPGGMVDLTGTTVTAGPAMMSGLATEIEYHFFTGRAVVRAVYTFANASDTDINTNVIIGGEYGSDDEAIIQATASGDLAITAADGWYFTSDGDPGDYDDPSILVARFGPGAAEYPSTTNVPGSGANDYFREEFGLTVPAGESVKLMFLIELHENDDTADLGPAIASGADYNSLATLNSAGLLAGLSAADQDIILNWTSPPAAAPSADAVDARPVPSLPLVAQGLLTGLVGGAGLHAMRRRKRKKA